MKLSELSDRMGELGQPLGITGLSKIENGKRGVDLDELVGLARALDVPPLLLIFPIGSEPTVEVLPGVYAPTWPAACWFTGEGGFPTPGPDGGWDVVGDDRYIWLRAVTDDFRAQEVAIDRWRRAAASRDYDAQQSYEQSLRVIRARIRDRGLDPGELAEDVAHLDRTDNGQR